MKSGFVTILGRPNVGKSTLINTIIGKKISIISPKSQTTRDAIQGIYNDEDSQIIFVDTPGIHKPKTELEKEMDKIAYYNAKNNDLVLLMVDASKRFSDSDLFISKNVRFTTPVIIVFSKIDLTNVLLINELKEKYKEFFPNSEMIEISSLENFNIDFLISRIKSYLPEGPQYYDINTITNRDFTFMVQEIIREKALNNLSDEIPHGIAVTIERLNERETRSGEIVLDIDATIYCEKESHKGIIIGKGGSMLKLIGGQAREELESFFQIKVNLQCWVKVKEGWRNREGVIRNFGLS